jgi:hypothetical protein
MANGLIMCESDFKLLPVSEQNCLLYRNQVKTLELMSSYKIYYKLTSWIGGILIAGMGYLFKLQLGG